MMMMIVSPVPEWGCRVWGRGWRGGVAARCPPQPRGGGSPGAGGRLTSPGGWGRGRGPGSSGATRRTPAWCPPGAWAVTQSTPGQQGDTVRPDGNMCCYKLLHYILYPLPRSLAWKYIQSRNFSCKSCFFIFYCQHFKCNSIGMKLQVWELQVSFSLIFSADLCTSAVSLREHQK